MVVTLCGSIGQTLITLTALERSSAAKHRTHEQQAITVLLYMGVVNTEYCQHYMLDNMFARKKMTRRWYRHVHIQLSKNIRMPFVLSDEENAFPVSIYRWERTSPRERCAPNSYVQICAIHATTLNGETHCFKKKSVILRIVSKKGWATRQNKYITNCRLW